MNDTNVSLPGEVWKDVTGYEGRYQISTLGRILSTFQGDSRILKPGSNRHGYLNVVFSVNKVRKNFRVHRLVGLAFLPLVEGKTCVNHIDAVKPNNCLSNLEWVTYKENTAHAQKLGNLPGPKLYVYKRDINRGRLLSYEQADQIRHSYNIERVSMATLARKYSVKHGVICGILSGKTYLIKETPAPRYIDRTKEIRKKIVRKKKVQ